MSAVPWYVVPIAFIFALIGWHVGYHWLAPFVYRLDKKKRKKHGSDNHQV